MLLRTLRIGAVTLVAAACAADAPRSVTVERTDSAGVAIVMNRGEDVPLAWTFTRSFSVGGADAGPESFYGVRRSGVAVGPDGSLYILDSGNSRIVVFDSTGAHRRTLGRKGGGPGEFQLWPSGLALEPGGSVGAFDIGKRGRVRFGPDGAVLPTRHIDLPFIGGAMAFADSLLLFSFKASGKDAEVLHDRLVALDPKGDTTTIAQLARPAPKMVDFGCVNLALGPIFAPEIVWASGGGRVFVATGPDYAVAVYEGRRPVASIRRDVPPRAATEGLARREVRDTLTVRFGRGGACEIPGDEVVEKRGFAPVIPAVDALAVAPDGTLWVRRRGVGDEEAPVDLFSADGEYLGTLPAGSPFPVAFFPDGRIVAVETDEFDLQHVTVYDVGGPGTPGNG